MNGFAWHTVSMVILVAGGVLGISVIWEVDVTEIGFWRFLAGYLVIVLSAQLSGWVSRGDSYDSH